MLVHISFRTAITIAVILLTMQCSLWAAREVGGMPNPTKILSSKN